jgi:hypothetical protein
VWLALLYAATATALLPAVRGWQTPVVLAGTAPTKEEIR